MLKAIIINTDVYKLDDNISEYAMVNVDMDMDYINMPNAQKIEQAIKEIEKSIKDKTFSKLIIDFRD